MSSSAQAESQAKALAPPAPIYIWMFCGYAGSGKTQAANHLQSLMNPATTFVTAFADAVKDDVADMYKIPRAMFDTQEGKASFVKTPDGKRKARDLLINYSLAMKEAHGEAVWAEEVVRRIRSVSEHQTIKHIILHDLRFTTEVETMYKEFDSSQHTFVLRTIRIVRPSVQSLPIPSEHNLDDYVADICVENNGTVDELHTKIEELFRAVK
jgi:dephospho-CoA kinase